MDVGYTRQHRLSIHWIFCNGEVTNRMDPSVCCESMAIGVVATKAIQHFWRDKDLES